MKALVDADILRYEVGFGAETGWHGITQDKEALPPFDYVRDMLEWRLNRIMQDTGADSTQLYLTEGETFRFKIAKKKPYKGTRVVNKPFHYDNLTVFMRDCLGARMVTNIEADDALAIDNLDPKTDTILCSRDKDLRQVPGKFYSWELGQQAAFGPLVIDKMGDLVLQAKPLKLSGTGLAWFCAQCLMGDSVDNIPGLPHWGPAAAYELLGDNISITGATTLELVEREYENYFGDSWKDELLEQGQLLWMVRRLNADGTPELWQLGQTE